MFDTMQPPAPLSPQLQPFLWSGLRAQQGQQRQPTQTLSGLPPRRPSMADPIPPPVAVAAPMQP